MLNTIEEGIKDFKLGKFIIVIDDQSRENEGDLIIAAEKVDAKAINFMARKACGLICMPTEKQRLLELELEPMVINNEDTFNTAFTVSVDVKKDITTGISAYDRAKTVQALINSQTKPNDLARPGHLFPLIAREGGVLTRPGHTEAAIDLAKLTGLYPAGVICEIINEDGTMARLPELKEFAQKYNLKIISIADLVEYRKDKKL